MEEGDEYEGSESELDVGEAADLSPENQKLVPFNMNDQQSGPYIE